MKLGLKIALLLAWQQTGVAFDSEPRLVKEYHVMERSKSLLGHKDQIIAGRTGTSREGASFVEGFNPKTMEMISNVKINHAIRSFQKVDECVVAVLGVNSYTLIDYCSRSNPSSQTYNLGNDVVAHAIAVQKSKGAVFYDPNLGFMTKSPRGSSKTLAPKISFTRQIAIIDGAAWISSYFNLTKMDLRTGKKNSVYKTNQEIYGIKRAFEYIGRDGEVRVAASTRDDKKVIGVSAKTGRVVLDVDVDAEPEGISTYGSCLVVADVAQKHVLVLNPERKVGDELVVTWDASKAGDRLKHPSEIVVDMGTNQIFLRSSYPCLECSVTQSSLFAFAIDDVEALSECID